MFHFRASLLSLPSELIEEIIIISTLLGDVRAPSTLAQTCRAFRTLIYQQVHNHLWREMFLVLFDDPRPAHEVRAHGRMPHQIRLDPNNKGKGKSKNNVASSSHDFPWEDEYKMRIWTESFILRRTQPPLSGSPSPRDARSDLPSTDAELYTILETLLRVILTALPLPYHTLASMASYCPPGSQLHPHPFFSPVLIVAHTHPTLGHVSRNISWLARVLAHGLPRALLTPLTVLDEDDKVDVQKEPARWDGLLAKLVAQVGLMTPYNGAAHAEHTVRHGDNSDRHITPEPESWNQNQEVTHDLSDDDSDLEPQPETSDSGESDGESESDVGSEYLSKATVISATASWDGVRRLARLRVYNQAYLHPSRAFGPFLPLRTQCTSSSSPTTQNLGSGAVDDEERQTLVNHDPVGLGSPSIPILPVPPIPEIDSEMDGIVFSHILDDIDGDADPGNDEEIVEDATAVAQSSGPPFLPPLPSQYRSSPNFPAEEGGDIIPIPRCPMPINYMSGTRRMYNPCITGAGDQALDFDWAWIAAARLVIELNLRDLLRRNRHQGVLRALLSLEGLRPCSAPGFPASVPERGIDLGEGEGGRTFKDGEGWDWAGVEGQWRCVSSSSGMIYSGFCAKLDPPRGTHRRCVCWMDYRDLIGAFLTTSPTTPRKTHNPISSIHYTDNNVRIFRSSFHPIS